VTLERYEDHGGRKVPVRVGELGWTPLRDLAITGGPGSYRLILAAPGRVEVRYPVLLGPGERFKADVPLPAEKEAPEGYVYVPEGRFLLGSAEPEPLRKGFMVCPPLHEARTKGFWIARTEVTFGEWIAFLNALPAAEREKRTPFAQSVMWGVKLIRSSDRWQLTLTLNGEAHTANEGEPLRVQARPRRDTLRWTRLPVAGISIEDVEAYFRWLDGTGKVPGARLCEEREWEHAARGADARLFPHGDLLEADDADFDQTYQRSPLAFGPDEAGSHPASESPFGLWDMAGNVYEVSRSMEVSGESVMRGGTWYYDSMSAMIPNRTMAERKTRDHLMGVRGCAER
jgi:formylglycine-generating enzyme required for sulfatase activity